MRKHSSTRYRSSRYSGNSEGNSHNRPRKKKKFRIKKSIMKFISTMAVILSSLMIIGSIALNSLTKDIGDLNKAMLEGRYMHSEIVKIEDVPQHMKDAVVAIEDSRFYSHKGVDLLSLIRVLIKNAIYDTSEGGSTLEMQISKNLVTSSEKTIERKLKDMKVAHEMNKSMSKDDILQIYLNSIYLNRGATGIKAGARMFFAKDVSELNLAESALLAGITKNPSKYAVYNIEDITTKDTLKTLNKKLLFKTVNESNAKVDEKVANHLLKLNLISEKQHKLMLEGKLIVQKAVLNKDSIARQKVVLERMKDLNLISKKDFEKALNTKIVIDTSLR